MSHCRQNAFKNKVLRISVGYLCLCIAAGSFETETSSEHSSYKVSGEGPEPSEARLWGGLTPTWSKMGLDWKSKWTEQLYPSKPTFKETQWLDRHHYANLPKTLYNESA